MEIRFLLLAGLGAICFGCATPPEQPIAATTAAPAKATTQSAPTRARSRASLTGSRLPPLDEDDLGASSVSAVTGEDYRHDDDARIKILRGESGAARRLSVRWLRSAPVDELTSAATIRRYNFFCGTPA